jgi:integrase
MCIAAKVPIDTRKPLHSRQLAKKITAPIDALFHPSANHVMKIKKRKHPDLGRYVWDIDFTLNGARIREPDFASRQAAEDFYLELRDDDRRARYGLPVRPKLKQTELILLAEVYAKHEAANTHRDNWRKEGPALERFVKWLDEEQGVTALIDLTPEHLATYRKHLEGKSYKPGTVTNYLAIVGMMLNGAKRHWATELAQWVVPTTRKPGGVARTRLISAHELIAVHRALMCERRAWKLNLERASYVTFRHDIADLWLLGFFTGARIGELLRLPASAFNREHKTLLITASKTKQAGTEQPTQRVLTLAPTAVQILAERTFTEGKVFKPYADTKVRETLRQVCEDSKLEYGQHLPNGFTFHDLRHTMATVLHETGFEVNTIGQFLGHSDRSRQSKTTTFVYLSSRPERRAAAAQCLEDYYQTACRDFDDALVSNGNKPSSMCSNGNLPKAANY